MKIKILYEDANILAIDKPSGILVHPAPSRQGGSYETGPDEKTVVDIFKKKYPKLEIVHRLDRDTSGVLLLAKNKKAHEFLKKQFQDRTVKKIYHAIVNGWVKDDHGFIKKPIGRSPKDFRRHLSGRGARGEMREAITEYKVLKRFQAKCSQNSSSCALPRVRSGTLGNKNFVNTLPFTYLEVRPKTGRTHQIRVHMKFINHPVVCDSLYNPNGSCPKGLKRMGLHAKSIEFQNLKNEIIKIELPMPKEFVNIVR
ncbi:MAG: RluA family pseudouridine synthase [Patescibacteria group bacterium]